MLEEAIAEQQLKWIGVDFDKTICQNSGYPNFDVLEPIDGAREALHLLASQGWKIIIYTARAWHEYDMIENWLNKNNIPFRRVVCGKLFVKYMIDDRNIEFHGNWDDVVQKIK